MLPKEAHMTIPIVHATTNNTCTTNKGFTPLLLPTCWACLFLQFKKNSAKAAHYMLLTLAPLLSNPVAHAVVIDFSWGIILKCQTVLIIGTKLACISPTPWMAK